MFDRWGYGRRGEGVTRGAWGDEGRGIGSGVVFFLKWSGFERVRSGRRG